MIGAASACAKLLMGVVDRRQAPRQPKSRELTRSVVNVPELLSPTYRNRVRKPSPRNRNSGVQANLPRLRCRLLRVRSQPESWRNHVLSGWITLRACEYLTASSCATGYPRSSRRPAVIRSSACWMTPATGRRCSPSLLKRPRFGHVRHATGAEAGQKPADPSAECDSLVHTDSRGAGPRLTARHT